jgi:hypothetical protein
MTKGHQCVFVINPKAEGALRRKPWIVRGGKLLKDGAL